MPRYSPSKDTESQKSLQRSSSKSIRVEPRSNSQQSNPTITQKSMWRNPLVWLGIAAALGTLLYPILQDGSTTKVISIHAVDVSDSGITEPEIPQTICKARAERLISGDVATNLDFSDRAELTSSQTVENSTDLNQQCQLLFTNGKNRPKQISKNQGTDPISTFSRIQNVVVSERSKGNQNPVVVTMWLKDAEQVLGKPKYDFGDFQKRVESITSDRGKVAIIGTTGELREDLENRFAKNPAVFLCTARDSAACIRRTFEAARTIKP